MYFYVYMEVLIMANNKHLTKDNRFVIESMLNNRASFKEIAATLDKYPSTISKEIRSHLIFRRVGGMRVNYNPCALRFQCNKSRICSTCHSQRKYSLCKRCSMCSAFCKDFQKEIYNKLLKLPYVCNGCPSFSSCHRTGFC